jgi:hypothetical protein
MTIVPATIKKNHAKSCISKERSPNITSLMGSKRIDRKIQKRRVKIILVLFMPVISSQWFSNKKRS